MTLQEPQPTTWLAHNMKAARRRKKMSQRALAKLIAAATSRSESASRALVRRLEDGSGTYRWATVDTPRELARAIAKPLGLRIKRVEAELQAWPPVDQWRPRVTCVGCGFIVRHVCHSCEHCSQCGCTQLCRCWTCRRKRGES